MLNDLLDQVREYSMITPGDRVYCAVSGGADSMALLWSLYLLREKLGVEICAAHFNHCLRGEESNRDEAFVRDFCRQFDIPLEVSTGKIQPGKKGLEAAAREARYAFFRTLHGKVATAHTADDNAETVLLHLVRGTGLKGLGGITPVQGNVIRPMLTVTREQVLAFLDEYHIGFVEDSSNQQDLFLRNRLRHHVMPLLRQENPRLAENLSQMAMALRQDASLLDDLAGCDELPLVSQLRAMPQPLRSRILEQFLKKCGVREPERRHIALAEELVFSQKPSARGEFPNHVILQRSYDRLEKVEQTNIQRSVVLPREGTVQWPALGLQIVCGPAETIVQSETILTLSGQGPWIVRSRKSGDEIRLAGGKKSLKKLFIDKKIPQAQRHLLPVVADDTGVAGVYGIGADLDRAAKALPAVQIRFEQINSSEKL